MNDNSITFLFENNERFQTTFKKEQTIREIFKKQNIFPDIKIDDLSFYYKGNIIDKKTECKYFIDKNNNIFVVSKKNISNQFKLTIPRIKRYIYCSKCHNNCLINFNGYRINLKDCEKGHLTPDISLEKFYKENLLISSSEAEEKSVFCF